MTTENKNEMKDTGTNGVKKEDTKNTKTAETHKVKKKGHFTIVTAISILLVISVALLGLSMWAYKNRDDIKAAAKATVQPTINPSDSTVTTSALPEELTKNDSITVLVDKSHTLPADYVPSDLSTPYLNSATDVIQLRQEAGDKAKEMKDAASAAGVSLYVTAGYRSYEAQATIYSSRVDLVGETQASMTVAKAGSSEHQTGLAIDFSDSATNTSATESFADTDAGKWLYEHAHEYGYILRYPKGKESITGFSYMPWHYRYVGVDVATAIYNIDKDETFEEYFNIASASSSASPSASSSTN